MPRVKLREKEQLTIPAELLQEWSRLHNVVTNDSIEVNLSITVVVSKREQISSMQLVEFE
jgi:hypothetical protein